MAEKQCTKCRETYIRALIMNVVTFYDLDGNEHRNCPVCGEELAPQEYEPSKLTVAVGLPQPEFGSEVA
jgi:hypothetical protein